MSNLLNTRIGILGGGQLGKMLIESFSPLNARYTVLEQSEDCPAFLVCKDLIEGSLYDEDAIDALAKRSDVLTYEIEHVNVAKLKDLEASTPVFPKPSVLEIIQDKGLQKEYYKNNNISTLPYLLVGADELKDALDQYPHDAFVLKHRKGGYDGKGVQLLSKTEFKNLHANADSSLGSEHGYVIEDLCKDAREVSVIVAVSQQGEIDTYDASEMVFDPKANLMDYLISPAEFSTAVLSECKDLAIAAVKGFNSPGIFAVEMFIDDKDQVFVNEIAPRPHNSGHHTIESCYTSQYEQLNRILLNMPLGSTKQIKPALTANILGPEDVNGKYYLAGLEEVMKVEGVYLHMYGKTTTKPYRKLGHFNVIADTNEECIERMNKVRDHLRIKALD